VSKDLSELWHPASPEDVLTVFVEVGKTGSTTVKGTMHKAVELRGNVYCIINLQRLAVERGVVPQVCYGSAMIFGASFGDCTVLAPGRRCQYLTTLREPGNRTVSEYNYFCRNCANTTGCRDKCCSMNPPCPNISFLEWARNHAESFTQHFAPPAWPPTRKWTKSESGRRSSFFYQYTHGFPARPRVNGTDYERALHVLSGDGPVPMLAIKLEQLDVDGWERIEKFLASPGLRLRSVAEKVNEHSSDENNYQPTAHEMAEVREGIDAYDEKLFLALP